MDQGRGTNVLGPVRFCHAFNLSFFSHIHVGVSGYGVDTI